MTGRCSACGRPDAIGLGLCAECGASGDSGDTLVFVRRSTQRGDRRATHQNLSELLGGRARTREGRLVARGGMPLIRVPAAISSRVIESLERRGVPARSVEASRAVLAMPSHFFLMVGAVATLGTMAGVASGSTSLAIISPLLASGLVLIAHRSMQKPWLRTPAGAGLPESAENALVGAFARLGASRSRELLADLAGLARPLVARLRKDGDPGALEDTIADLVAAACDTAMEVDRLEASAAVVRDELGSTGDDGTLRGVADRCDDAARVGIGRLVEAVVTIADAGSRTALLDGSASERLADLLRDLRDGAAHREQALAEVARLLDQTATARH